MYSYSVSFSQDRIVSESLVYYPSGRPRMVFMRSPEKEKYSGKQKKLKEFVTSSTAFLVIGAKYNDEICSKVRSFILGIIDLKSEDIALMAEMSYEWASGEPSRKSLLISGLRKADLAIVDFDSSEVSIDKELVRQNIPPAVYDKIPSDGGKVTMKSIRLMHGYGCPDLAGKKIPFEMEKESAGTRSMFGILGPLADALMKGRTLIVDEFGAYLHPILTHWIVSQFSAVSNPNGAQLIVMTHDVGLIDTENLLRRDQIFFTDKDRSDGSSRLYCLSDFKGIRKDELILKSYMAGKYDAVPDVSFRGLMDDFGN